MNERVSEQQAELELASEPALDDPNAWLRDDPDLEPAPSDDDPAAQLTKPGGGEPRDEEPTEIAEEFDPSVAVGPEQQAMRIDDEPG